MVKKLFKHEIAYYARIMVIVYSALLGVAAFSRILQFFSSENIIYKIVDVFSTITYCVAIVATLGFAVVLSIIRFYKNLFTKEGYLTFTLPISPTQHILVKSITAVLVQIASIIAIILSFYVFTMGELFKEIMKAGIFLLKQLKRFSIPHITAYAFEITALLIVTAFAAILLYYLYISIGQLFNKNRILAAVGAYFIHYIITEVITTVITIILTLSSPFEKIVNFMQNYPYASIHIILLSYLVFSLILTFVYFIVVKFIITKKLNLE